MLVDDDHVKALVNALGQGSGRRRIQDKRLSQLMAQSRHGLDCAISNLQLRNDRPRTFKDRSGRRNHRRIDGFIGGFCDGDQILARDAVDEDQRDTARQTLDALEQAAIAASTEADKNALQLLRNEADMMTAWANQVEADRQQLNAEKVVDPNALKDDQTLAKIQKCNQFLNSMVLSGTFNDDPSCH